MATTDSVAVLPLVIVVEAGWVVIVGGAAFTVTVAAVESTVPAALLTRTQYDALSVKARVVKLDEFVPTGVVVVPTVP